MKNVIRFLLLLGMALPVLRTFSAEPGEEVVLIYNIRVPESKSVAEYYAQKRNVPKAQILGFDLTSEDDITRHDFREKLQRPLLKALESKGLISLETQTIPATNNTPKRVARRVVKTKVRYLIPCYGVPLRIANDTSIHEAEADKMQAELRKNGAAVDSELACLTLLEQNLMLSGPFPNRGFGVTNAAFLSPTNDVFIVSRLDGPTASIARSLVDKAMDAETNGLWGRAYFDMRGLTNGDYKLGDDWIYGASEVCRSVGFETIVDSNGGTFAASFPLSQAAFYAGWYDEQVSGPFARGTAEFMPGAFAYHLHSFSAATLHSATRQWAGPLLAHGATATMGCVDEPFLPGTPNLPVFFGRFIYSAYTYGEAACACQNYLSWQITVVGDPLYRPFLYPPMQLREKLTREHNKLVEWDYVRIINSSRMRKVALPTLIHATETADDIKTSAVLQEKLAELYFDTAQTSSSVASLQQALKLDPSPQQRIRVSLNLAKQLWDLHRDQEAYEVYQNFLKDSPTYADPAAIYRPLVELATQLGHKEDATRYQSELAKLK